MTDHASFVVLGTGGTFTEHVIQTLINKNYRPDAYIQSANKPQQNHSTFAKIKLEILKPPSTLSVLLDNKNIPVLYQSQIQIDQFIEQLNVEFLLVACWPKLLPDMVINSVAKAALNLHPSLLPNFRGTDPVGDQLKSTDQNFGISLHLISQNYDAGDIVLQQTLEVDKQLGKSAIEIVAAATGATLFIQAIKTFMEPGWKLIRQKDLSTGKLS